MNPEIEALERVICMLEALAIPYMVTGSVASSHHGRPRTTHDIDIVIDPTPETLTKLVGELVVAGFYVDRRTAEGALRRRRLFNAIEMQTACKLDLIIRKERPFSREELARRQRAELAAGLSVVLATPEDSILSKLEWARKGGESERQLRDAAGVVDVKGAGLDRAYIKHWAKELGVSDLWRRIARGRLVPLPRRAGPDRGR